LGGGAVGAEAEKALASRGAIGAKLKTTGFSKLATSRRLGGGAVGAEAEKTLARRGAIGAKLKTTGFSKLATSRRLGGGAVGANSVHQGSAPQSELARHRRAIGAGPKISAPFRSELRQLKWRGGEHMENGKLTNR